MTDSYKQLKILGDILHTFMLQIWLLLGILYKYLFVFIYN